MSTSAHAADCTPCRGSSCPEKVTSVLKPTSAPRSHLVSVTVNLRRPHCVDHRRSAASELLAVCCLAARGAVGSSRDADSLRRLTAVRGGACKETACEVVLRGGADHQPARRSETRRDTRPNSGSPAEKRRLMIAPCQPQHAYKRSGYWSRGFPEKVRAGVPVALCVHV